MTYHFASMDELLMEAFTRFAGRISEAFEARLDAAPDRQAALEAIVSLIHEDLQRSRAEHVVTYELYTLAARNPDFRMTQVMRASRRACSGTSIPPQPADSTHTSKAPHYTSPSTPTRRPPRTPARPSTCSPTRPASTDRAAVTVVCRGLSDQGRTGCDQHLRACLAPAGRPVRGC